MRHPHIIVLLGTPVIFLQLHVPSVSIIHLPHLEPQTLDNPAPPPQLLLYEGEPEAGNMGGWGGRGTHGNRAVGFTGFRGLGLGV